MHLSRRQLLAGVPSSALSALIGTVALVACVDESIESDPTEPDSAGDVSGSELPMVGTAAAITELAVTAGWRMPAEDDVHERTWMCWPSSAEVWGDELGAVQDAIVAIARKVARFEPVAMLARPAEIAPLTDLFGDLVELIGAPVDDLWARDSLPNFVVRTAPSGTKALAAAHATFNGWGDKQLHDGDTQLADIVARHLGIELLDSGLVGEGGAVEVDGAGVVLAAESCWVNDNRNPGRSRGEIETAILDMLGAKRMIWVDGLAGHDITDGHIDTLARFVGTSTIVVDNPAFDDPEDPWVAVAATTRQVVGEARTGSGEPYEIVEVTQPAEVRVTGEGFLATYMNFYVCNGAVIAPRFGDAEADTAAHDVLAGLFPDREIVQVDIDALAAGGGGIHCATQQQPKVD